MFTQTKALCDKFLEMGIPGFDLIVYKDGKCIFRSCSYVADFVYEQNGETVVEDTKGFRTPDYILKRKMMLFFLGVRIKEV